MFLEDNMSAYTSGKYRNVFKEIGKSEEEINKKKKFSIRNSFLQ